MEYIPYNSRNISHKSPFGAVDNETTISLKVILPRELMCSGVSLLIHADEGETREHSLAWAGMEGSDQEWWAIDYKPGQTGLYFYHFVYYTAFGASHILHDGSALGSLRGGVHEWQLTVFDSTFSTPNWLKGGVIYQIFPDRFCSSGNKKQIGSRIMKAWGDEPKWKADSDGKFRNDDFFGGDLKGVAQKLDYLKSLGVSCIYFNPVFMSSSNHRYDTASYHEIDPLLGDEEELKELCKRAKEKGINIILDGVFSHTGDDSVYFNRYGNFKSVGAYQSRKSPYFDWYRFNSFPNDYECWWGFKTLPEVDEENDGYIEFITGAGGVIQKWMNVGVKGWRLDVADELPDKFLDALRLSVKKNDNDAIIIGEVWEDASNKSSYSKRRRYLLGSQLDSVMNYPFADAILSFIRSGEAERFSQTIEPILENYPKCVVDVLMNHIGTHDTARAITRLAGENCEYRDRDWQSKTVLSTEQYEKGKKLLKLASLLQYTLPGVPSLYYGDEAGMQGYKDPFNRGCYPWGNEDKELLKWYRRLGSIRRSCKCLKSGEYRPVSETMGVVCFERIGESDELLVIINRNEAEIDYKVPDKWENTVALIGEISGKTVKMPPISGALLRRIK